MKCNLQEFSKNIVNQSKKESLNNIEPKNGSKVAFVPIKNKIQQMEKQQLRLKQEFHEFEQKFKTITADRNSVKDDCLLIEVISADDEIVKLEQQKEDFDYNDTEFSKSEEKTDDNCIDDRVIIMIPPKPLPRTSISEQGSFDECNFSSTTIVPKPRPRSSANHSYKVLFYFTLICCRLSI